MSPGSAKTVRSIMAALSSKEAQWQPAIAGMLSILDFRIAFEEELSND